MHTQTLPDRRVGDSLPAPRTCPSQIAGPPGGRPPAPAHQPRRALGPGPRPQHRHVLLGDPQHASDPAAGKAHLGQPHRCQVAQTRIGRLVAEQHARPDGDEHLAVDLDAMQVPWCWHAYQHGLYRNPDCHYHYCIEIEHLSHVHLNTKPQVTPPQRRLLQKV